MWRDSASLQIEQRIINERHHNKYNRFGHNFVLNGHIVVVSIT